MRKAPPCLALWRHIPASQPRAWPLAAISGGTGASGCYLGLSKPGHRPYGGASSLLETLGIGTESQERTSPAAASMRDSNRREGGAVSPF